MRLLQVVGLVLVLLGGYVLVRGFSYTSRKSVVEIGEFQAALEEKREVPRWAGGVAVTAGLLLLVAGVRRRP
jgi:hypothetical protein